ncbi:hypothetical protein HUJ05_009596 [Dendroctonus ponderosae]|nr:hypothetical protein HUJ05_009596 [Dendroctonus ponderosae]
MMAMFCHVGQEGHVKLGFDPEYLGLKMLNYVITETKQYFADLTDYGSWRCCSWTDGSTVLHRFCAVANDFFAFMRRFQKQVVKLAKRANQLPAQDDLVVYPYQYQGGNKLDEFK